MISFALTYMMACHAVFPNVISKRKYRDSGLNVAAPFGD